MKKRFLLPLLLCLMALFSMLAFSSCDILAGRLPGGGTTSGTSISASTSEEKRETLEERKHHILEEANMSWRGITQSDTDGILTKDQYNRFETIIDKITDAADFDSLTEAEHEMHGFFNECEALIRGGITIILEPVPYKDLGDNATRTFIEMWSEEPASLQELINRNYTEYSLFRITFWDRYVPMVDDQMITGDYVFTESKHVICVENEPDFHITVHKQLLSGTRKTIVHDCWGTFTFWNWTMDGWKPGARVLHEYNREMAQFPYKRNGELMQPNDVLNSDCTIEAEEQLPLCEIDIVVEIDGNDREHQRVQLWYSHSIETLLKYDVNANSEDDYTYYLDWYDITFNGEEIKNYEIDEYILQEDGVLKFTGRGEYRTEFIVELRFIDGTVETYGPYSVVTDGYHELYGQFKANIVIDEFLRGWLGDELYTDLFENADYFIDGHRAEMIDFSRKVFVYIEEDPGITPPEPPSDDDELNRLIQDTLIGMNAEWSGQVAWKSSIEHFKDRYEEFVAKVRNAKSESEVNEYYNQFYIMNMRYGTLYANMYEFQVNNQDSIFYSSEEQKKVLEAQMRFLLETPSFTEEEYNRKYEEFVSWWRGLIPKTLVIIDGKVYDENAQELGYASWMTQTYIGTKLIEPNGNTFGEITGQYASAPGPNGGTMVTAEILFNGFTFYCDVEIVGKAWNIEGVA